MKHPLTNSDLWYEDNSNDYWLLASYASSKQTAIKRILLCNSSDRSDPDGVMRRLQGPRAEEILSVVSLPVTRQAAWAIVRTLPIPVRLHLLLVKEIRQRSMDAQRKTWDEVLSPAIVKWAWNEIARAEREVDDHCVDNYRVARSGNTAQVRRFRQQSKNGCCGSHEWSAIGPDGWRYFLGFNYGH